MRQQEVGETPGNSSGFLTRCVLFEPPCCKKTLIIELESQHQGGHHQLPGQGSPTERYPYYDNRYLQASLVEAMRSQFMFSGRDITATLVKRAGTSPCQELYPGGLRWLQAPKLLVLVFLISFKMS